MRIGREDYDKGASDGPREQPAANETYEAVIGTIEDVGVQPGFKDQGPRPMVCIAFELSERDSKGGHFVLFQKYGLNLFKSKDGSKVSNLRALFDTLRPGTDNSEVDTADFVGMNCRVLVSHDAKGRARVDRVLPAKPGQGVKAEKDYSEPWGLTKWLLDNRVDRE